MNKIIIICGSTLVYGFICWHGMPEKSDQQKTMERIDAIIALSQVSERERHFCPITGIYAR